MKILTIISIIFWSGTSFLGQTSYFVANNGDDNNSGTSANLPWKTIKKINNTDFKPGDKIFFQSANVFDDDGLVINKSGTAENRIVFGKYGGELPPVIGSVSLNKSSTIEIWANFVTIQELYVQAGTSSKGSKGIVIFGNNNLVTQNIVKGGPTSQRNVAGIAIGAGFHFNIISKNEVKTFGNGIIGYNCFNTIIERNVVHDIWREGASSEFGGQAIRLISNNFPDAWFDFKYTSTIRYNEVYDFERYGIDCATATNVIIENNLIHQNLPSSYRGTDNHGTGIKASERNNITKQGSVGNIVRYNIIRDLKGSKGEDANIAISTLNSEDGWIYGNLIYNIEGIGIKRNGLKLDENIGNWSWKIFHNTIISQEECIWIWADAESPTFIQNNILSSKSENCIHSEQNIFEGNNIFKDHSKDNAIFQKYRTYTSIGESYFNVDPILNEDFTLNANSPAIDNGAIPNISEGNFSFQDINGTIITGKPDIGAFQFNVNTNNSTFQNNSELLVFLEGCYGEQKMIPYLLRSNFFQNEQPYSSPPWNLNDNSTNVTNDNELVDWIIVELRNSLNKISYSKAAIIKTSGKVINPDGTNLTFKNIVQGEYYITIRHRNHLDIISAQKVEINNNIPINYDFTDSQSKAYGTNPMVELSSGKFGMFAGDADKNNIINNLDFGSVANDIPQKGYINSDLDMNCVVNVLDYDKVNKNILKYSQVPDVQ